MLEQSYLELDCAETAYGKAKGPAITIRHGRTLRQATRRNHQLHFGRVAVRLAALVVADATIMLLLFLFVPIALGRSSFMAQPTLAVASAPLPNLMLAMLAGLAFSGSYGQGEMWRSEPRLLRGVALGWIFIILPSAHAPGSRHFLIPELVSVFAFAMLMAYTRKAVEWCKKRWMVHANVGIATVILGGNEGDCLRALSRRDALQTTGIDIVDVINMQNMTPADLAVALHDSCCEAALLAGECSTLEFREVIRAAIATGCQLYTIPHAEDFSALRPKMIWRAGQPFIEWQAAELRLPQLIAKRALDIVASATMLLVLLPVLGVIAAMVCAEDGWPFLFRQRRLGHHGISFLCLKFRSMYRNAEERLRTEPALWAEYVRNDFKLPAERDSRILPIGRWLRKTSLDEIPQLWNVLRGEMSLVGPRPIMPEELAHYSNAEPLFLSLKPGLTGAWQVGGRSSLAYPRRASVELEYIENWSFVTDLDIVLRTVPSVLFARGAH